MREDLLFHITTKDNWKEYKTNGNYEPKTLESEGFIKCSSGNQLEDTANRIFSDKDEILLLVIDVSLVREDIKYEEDEDTGKKYPHIYGPLSTNAIIDKIAIQAEENGTFNIAFTSDT